MTFFNQKIDFNLCGKYYIQQIQKIYDIFLTTLRTPLRYYIIYDPMRNLRYFLDYVTPLAV